MEFRNARMTHRKPTGRRARKQDPTSSKKVRARTPKNHHPLHGIMKRAMHIMPGTNLTQPADREWGKVWGEKS
jgi:hypothetical protein